MSMRRKARCDVGIDAEGSSNNEGGGGEDGGSQE